MLKMVYSNLDSKVHKISLSVYTKHKMIWVNYTLDLKGQTFI